MKRFLLVLSCVVAVSIARANAENLLVNGDFESLVENSSIVITSEKGGDLINVWKLVVKGGSAGDAMAVTSAAEVFDGEKSLKVQLQQINYRYRFFLVQEIINVAPKKYKLSFQMKADKADIPVRVDFVNIEFGLTKDDEFSKNPIKTATDWTKYEINLDLTAEQAPKALMRIAFRFNCLSGGGVSNEPVTYWLDNISLIEDDGTSSLPALAQHPQVQVYAVGNQVYFPQLETVSEVSVYNVAGVLKATEKVAPGQSLSILSSGCYILRVKTAEGTATTKLVVR